MCCYTQLFFWLLLIVLKEFAILISQPEKVQMDFLLQCCVLKEALQKKDYTYIAYKTI